MSEQNDNKQQPNTHPPLIKNTKTPPPIPKAATPPPPPAQKAHSFVCSNCGADIKYKPGSRHLICRHCNAENIIPETENIEVEELDFFKQLEMESESSNKIQLNIILCNVCGAKSTLELDVISADCPYCATPLVLNNAHIEAVIRPRSLLPFELSREDTNAIFSRWVSHLSLAPNSLKKSVGKLESLKGLYLPFWTYDANTVTPYTGKKGITSGSGSNKSTKWKKAKGTVYSNFDDILIAATDTLTEPNAEKINNWNLKSLIPFEPSYLSGFTTLKYQLSLNDSFSKALNKMEEGIKGCIRKDIGGDEQRITSYKPSYSNITFKHILLPIYISAYKYKNNVYRVIINGSTGKISAERPYSKIKVFLLAATITIGIGAFIYNLLS